MASTLYDKEPQPGDLIEIFRGVYEHWAVYVGKGFIVHLTSEDEGAGSSSVMSVATDNAVVSKEELLSVVGDCEWKINNSLDKEYKPRPADVIVKEACAMVGAELPYSVLSQNCEHWASKLRYGKAESRQVLEASEVLLFGGKVGAGVVVLAAVLLFAVYLLVADKTRTPVSRSAT